MSFQFRFAALLQFRLRQRDEAGAACGQAADAIERIIGQISTINEHRKMLRQEDQSARTGHVSVDSLLSTGRYDMQLEAEIISLRQTQSQLNEELARRRAALVAAEAEVKKLERLQENEQSEYHAQSRRREQFEADDATGRRNILERRAKNQ